MNHMHTSHPTIIARLKRAEGHLAKVIKMLEQQSPCADVAQQLHAVEKAVMNAKRALIHDHIDHCLTGRDDSRQAAEELKSISKYL
ncbi:metal-sensing transcriptional repressor (plasmid) [Ruegeria sp. SCSIO 43209]|nr:metal-sensing transcriptional repressor [Ruegeria sp. SCSIO 43209]UAB91471.1 metal-sensing transcriptional repressor [Ruegeria sp. SCSIO 43209]